MNVMIYHKRSRNPDSNIISVTDVNHYVGCNSKEGTTYAMPCKKATLNGSLWDMMRNFASSTTFLHPALSYLCT